MLLIEKPQGPPPATPGPRPGRPVSERHSLKRVLDVDQDAVTKVEESKVSKLRKAKCTDRGESTCDPR